ncbi:MAG: tetratricopeptide repeat protein [Acidobacteriia bacterium]|nr:tetratricopeptide repeat protein [Terriglobia bacterium]
MRSRSKPKVHRQTPTFGQPSESALALLPLEFSWLESLPTYKILAALLLLVLLAFANSLSGEFVFDDVKYIVHNESLRAPFNLVRVLTTDELVFSTNYSRDIALPYHGRLFTLCLMLGYRWFHLWTPGWHLLSILVHLGATLLVFLTVREFLGQKSIAAVTAILFAVHPIHSQAIAWATAGAHALLTLFFLLSLFFYLRARSTHAIRYWILSLTFFAVSTMFKESALSLTLVVIGLELLLPERNGGSRLPSHPFDGIRRVLVHSSGFLIISLLYLLDRYRGLGFLGWEHPLNKDVAIFDVILTIPSVLSSYLVHLTFPFRLSLIYCVDFIHSGTSRAFLISTLILVLLAIILFWLWRFLSAYQDKTGINAFVFAGLLFWIPLLPVLNLRAFHPEYLVQDRYAYLPSVGFCVGIALFWILLLTRIKPGWPQIGLTAALVVGFVAGTAQGNRIWHDSVALWSRAEVNRPHSWDVRYNRGLALLEHRRFAESERELLEAARLAPENPAVMNNLGLAQMNLTESDRALQSFEHAIQVDPSLVEAYNNLGTLQFRRDDLSAAEKTFRRALGIDPQSKEALYNLARLQMARRDMQAAADTWDHLVRLSPGDAEARWQFGNTLKSLNRVEEARSQWTRALQDAKDQALRKKIEAELNAR